MAGDTDFTSSGVFLDLTFFYNLTQVGNEFTTVCATRSSVLDPVLSQRI